MRQYLFCTTKPKNFVLCVLQRDSYGHIENVLNRSPGSDRSLSSSNPLERSYPTPTQPIHVANGGHQARRSNGVRNAGGDKYDSLRASLRRDESLLTEEAVGIISNIWY